jgi:hypothetical protein
VPYYVYGVSAMRKQPTSDFVGPPASAASQYPSPCCPWLQVRALRCCADLRYRCSRCESARAVHRKIGERRTVMKYGGTLRSLLLLAALTFASFAHAGAVLLAPANGVTNAPTYVSFSWTADPAAKAYYLYVGTTPGAKDVVNTGEIPATNWNVSGLPAGRAFYVRIWTIYTSSNSYNDSQFSTFAGAGLIAPTPGSTGIATSTTFQWNAVSGAGGYHLQLGSSLGTNDLADSGVLTNTQFAVSALPNGAAIFARMWTEIAGQWGYADYRYSTIAALLLLTPVQSGGVIDPHTKFAWTAMTGANMYYLYVGTTPGAKDAVNSGEIATTTFSAPPLNGNTLYYITIYAHLSTWVSVAYTVTTAPIAVLTSPVENQSNVDPTTVFHWTSVNGATAYYLYLGSAPGQTNIGNSGELAATMYSISSLPGGSTTYVRLWATYGGIWRYRDTSIGTRPVPRFLYPKNGALGTGQNVTFSWNPISGALSTHLTIGTSFGASDVLNTDVTGVQSFQAVALPNAPFLYAQLVVATGSTPVVDNVVFTPLNYTTSAYPVNPPNGGTYSPATAFQWTGNPLAAAYRLQVGTSAGLANVFDSGPVPVTQLFVPGLPVGSILYATLTTSYPSGAAAAVPFTFVANSDPPSAAASIQAAIGAVGQVRSSADFTNQPGPTGLLRAIIRSENRDFAICDDYATALVQTLSEMNVGIPYRTAGTCFNPNGFDCHTYVEIYDATQSSWVILDPTFGLIPRQVANGMLLPSTELATATRALNFSAIQFSYATSLGSAYARAYYLDYPLLFMQLFNPAYGTLSSPPASIQQDFQSVPLPYSSADGGYHPAAVQCSASGMTTEMLINGQPTVVNCGAPFGISPTFWARSVSADANSAPGTVMLQPLRFIF